MLYEVITQKVVALVEVDLDHLAVGEQGAGGVDRVAGGGADHGVARIDEGPRGMARNNFV